MESTLIKPVIWEKVLITNSSPIRHPVVIETTKDKEGRETCVRVRVSRRVIATLDNCENFRFSLERASGKLFRLKRDDKAGTIRLTARSTKNDMPTSYILAGVKDGPSPKDIAATLHALSQVNKFNVELDGDNIILIAVAS